MKILRVYYYYYEITGIPALHSMINCLNPTFGGWLAKFLYGLGQLNHICILYKYVGRM
jgi:hypothetical protein